MSRKKQPDYKKLAKKLKKHGIINFDLRKNLSPQQKGAITKQWRRYDQFLTGDYVKRHVNKKHQKDFDARKIKKIGKSYFINKEGFDEVHIKGNKIIRTKRDMGKRRTQTEIIKSPVGLIKELEQLENKKLPKGTFVTLRYAGNSTFNMAAPSYAELLFYVKNKMTFKEADGVPDMDTFIEGLELVTIENETLQ